MGESSAETRDIFVSRRMRALRTQGGTFLARGPDLLLAA
jgi:hypothetical protein